ncbi:hypothetical protein UCDDS831_g00304 [Diplodia seriata]|uniref:DUF6536 domain-containing protein n=1 Tax=Diplodia seriata TaxID=420778 RepID=A0A0G2F212_9PEZI|nr:hypothetical protein UCDDS831_g00304 [Diplodia seriata]
MSHRKSLERSSSPSSAVSRYSLSAYSTRSNGDNRGDYDKLELGDLSNTHLLSSTAYDPYGGSSRLPKARSISSLSATSDWTIKSKGKAFIERAKSTFRISKNVSRNERENTRPGHGLWSQLMLVDRTLRGMAALTATFAVVMVVICVVYAKDFREHMQDMPNSTSVMIASGTSSAMNRKAEAYKFLINIAATMILGMSNTYQQLLTALTVDDLKHALYKYGDSRVGTNSPFSIKHKRNGRLRAWLAWILLICVSEYYGLRLNVHYQLETNVTRGSSYAYQEAFDCYSALRTGRARLDPDRWEESIPGASSYQDYYTSASYCPANHSDPDNPFDETKAEEDLYTDITVHYEPESPCADVVNRSISHDAVWQEYNSGDYSNNYTYFGGCGARNFYCNWTGDTTVEHGDRQGHQVRLVMRMQAAIILAICITSKATYMIAVNVRNRREIKTHCLTFGDVLVASNFDTDLRIPSESMVNGGDFHRRAVSHTCHKHCKSNQLSDTGEELGHCQKCKKHNRVNNCPGLPWPALSTKRKKSLITNLGQTALTQMLTLSFCSVGMIAASIFIAIMFTARYAYAVCVRWTTYNEQFAAEQTFASMTINNLWGEIAAFLISNGAQLLYSCLYLLLIYNVTLICMEYEWGKFEKGRQRLRCTIVKSERFDESYFLQLPKKILFPIMVYSIIMHWLLGLAILAKEEIVDDGFAIYSRYNIVTVPDGVWGSCALLLAMTCACWWAYTYKREGFIPQMFGSIRTLCASTSNLSDFPTKGIHWGDLGTNETGPWRHAGLSEGEVGEIVPNELYA